MEKLKYLFLFILVASLSFAKNIDGIEDMTVEVAEKLFLNNELKESKYILKYIKPDFVRKEVLSPELNKGEVYIYTSEKKIVYLPLFDQVSEESIKSGEDNILESINYILKEQELKEGKINLENGAIIELKEIKKFSGYALPETIIIYDGDVEVASLRMKNYKMNTKLDREELSLHD